MDTRKKRSLQDADAIIQAALESDEAEESIRVTLPSKMLAGLVEMPDHPHGESEARARAWDEKLSKAEHAHLRERAARTRLPRPGLPPATPSLPPIPYPQETFVARAEPRGSGCAVFGWAALLTAALVALLALFGKMVGHI